MASCSKEVKAILLAAGLAMLLLTSLKCSGDAQLQRAFDLEREGDWASANEVYREILRDEPDNLTALRGLAVNLVLGGEHAVALPYQERIVRLDSGDAQTRVELAFNYLNHQQRPRAALRMMREAAELEPSPRNLTFLGQTLRLADRPAEAEHILREVIARAPSYEYSYRLLSDLLREQGRFEEAQVNERKWDALSTG